MIGIQLLAKYKDVVVKPRARDYLIDGEKYQRVTSAISIINKPALIPWAKRITLERVGAILLNPSVSQELAALAGEAPEVYGKFVQRLLVDAGKAADNERDAKADLGTEAHAIIHTALALSPDDIPGCIDRLTVEQQPAVRGALAFLRDFNITVLDAEVVVWNDVLQVAGTIDGVGTIGDGLVIWDWKRSAGIYWETALQLAAYATLLAGITGLPVLRAFAVRLPRTPAESYDCKQLDASALLSAFILYQNAFFLHRGRGKELWVNGNGEGNGSE